MSKKKTDANGFVTFRDCKFFCECVTQYLGKEIDDAGGDDGADLIDRFLRTGRFIGQKILRRPVPVRMAAIRRPAEPASTRS